MASIHKEVEINAPVAKVWDALRDVGALHTRLCPNFVVGTRLENGVRDVTFANGMTARERIVDVDDARRRVVWTVVENPTLTHHNGVAQALDAGRDRTRLLWTADVLPHEAAPAIGGFMEQGIQDIKATLEQTTVD